jgi:DNA-binding NarL/FixJ family response regulator
MKLPRVIVADDHTIVIEAFRKLLEPHCNVVATATDGRELLVAALSLNPDLILADIAMPFLNGLEAVRQLRAKNTGTKIVFLTMNDDPDVAGEAMRTGASGYLLKTSTTTELLYAIQRALKGKPYVTPRIAQAMEEAFVRGPRKNVKLPTPRQREVIQLLAEGKGMKEAADILNITTRTVAFHKYGAMEELGLKTSADLIQYAVRAHIVAA